MSAEEALPRYAWTLRLQFFSKKAVVFFSKNFAGFGTENYGGDGERGQRPVGQWLIASQSSICLKWVIQGGQTTRRILPMVISIDCISKSDIRQREKGIFGNARFFAIISKKSVIALYHFWI